MRRLLALLAVAGALVVLPVRPAGACSCVAGAPPPEIVFVGVSTGRTAGGWGFDVTRVDRGVVPDEVVVEMDVDIETRTEDGTAMVMSSSCSLGPAPETDRSYRVAASRHPDGGHRRLLASLCGRGELTSVGMPTAAPELAEDDSAVEPALVVVALLLVGAIFYVGGVRRSGGPAGKTKKNTWVP